MSDEVPTQRDEAWVRTASPAQIDAAFAGLQLHEYMGGGCDEAGWPVDPNGRRLDPKTRT